MTRASDTLDVSRAEELRTQSTLVSIFDLLLEGYPKRDFLVRVGDRLLREPSDGTARYSLVFRSPETVRKMFMSPSERSFGEAYIDGDFEIEGDLNAVFPLVDYLRERSLSILQNLRMLRLLRSLPRQSAAASVRRPLRLPGEPHSKERDRKAVTYHYDLPAAFYALWLDPQMVYSCAYFESEESSLAEAQELKLDRICRKLRLERDQRFLDIGCGWGGLLMFAARHYGVRALGVTLSQVQADFARAAIERAGLKDRCEVRVADYRDLDQWGQFDRLASVGMFEHVGAKKLEVYFQRAFRLLRPGGLFLNHGVAFCSDDPANRPSFSEGKNSFFGTYVFPDGELVPLSVTAQAAERSGFEVRDVESMREHYALTLRQFRSRLNARRDEALEMVNEATFRIWDLYLAAAIHEFAIARLTIYQVLLAKTDNGAVGLPLVRAL
jgi:cyclopropane-fatty-acyl-phospholipid synthase